MILLTLRINNTKKATEPRTPFIFRTKTFSISPYYIHVCTIVHYDYLWQRRQTENKLAWATILVRSKNWEVIQTNSSNICFCFSGPTFGRIRKNFDEIDRSGFARFAKRNFDEIDRSGFARFAKRNFDEIDRSGFARFAKRNFDEIDRSGFARFAKRNFDEIDNVGFRGFYY